MQWVLDSLLRQQKRLRSLTKMLFDDMERKDKQVQEVENNISELINEIYEKKRMIEFQMDLKQNLISSKSKILKAHDEASVELLRVMKEIDRVKYPETKGVVNQ